MDLTGKTVPQGGKIAASDKEDTVPNTQRLPVTIPGDDTLPLAPDDGAADPTSLDNIAAAEDSLGMPSVIASTATSHKVGKTRSTPFNGCSLELREPWRQSGDTRNPSRRRLLPASPAATYKQLLASSTCTDHTLVPILSKEACAVAGKALGLGVTMGGYVIQDENKPPGCVYSTDSDPAILEFNTNVMSTWTSSPGTELFSICQQPRHAHFAKIAPNASCFTYPPSQGMFPISNAATCKIAAKVLGLKLSAAMTISRGKSQSPAGCTYYGELKSRLEFNSRLPDVAVMPTTPSDGFGICQDPEPPEGWRSARYDHWIRYHAPVRGQGSGNLMLGLLAAHLLARYYKREVCVDWPHFNEAFRSFLPCPSDILNAKATTVSRWNFGETSLEHDVACHMASNARVVAWEGNDVGVGNERGEAFLRQKDSAETRAWLGTVFDREYTPSESLRDLLPSAHQPYPSSVVHLRVGDGCPEDDDAAECDFRGPFKTLGANWSTLAAELRRCAPNATLLADRQSVFQKLPGYGRQHAFVRERRRLVSGHSISARRTSEANFDHLNMHNHLAAWADWYLLTRAETVYHTASGFSESAIYASRTKGPKRFILGMSHGAMLVSHENNGDPGQPCPSSESALHRGMETSKVRRARTCRAKRVNFFQVYNVHIFVCLQEVPDKETAFKLLHFLPKPVFFKPNTLKRVRHQRAVIKAAPMSAKYRGTAVIVEFRKGVRLWAVVKNVLETLRREEDAWLIMVIGFVGNIAWLKQSIPDELVGVVELRSAASVEEATKAAYAVVNTLVQTSVTSKNH